MNGKRCAIYLGEHAFAVGDDDVDTIDFYVSIYSGTTVTLLFLRIFGSHSEAKRELKKWLPEWPDAKIVDERDL